MTRVELSDGAWMELRDDITMEEGQKIARAGKVFDPKSKEYRDDPMEAGFKAVEIVVVEWTVMDSTGNPAPPNGNTMRKLTLKRGREIMRIIDSHLVEQGLTTEDLGEGSAT